jgi:hypothetical protein
MKLANTLLALIALCLMKIAFVNDATASTTTALADVNLVSINGHVLTKGVPVFAAYATLSSVPGQAPLPVYVVQKPEVDPLGK